MMNQLINRSTSVGLMAAEETSEIASIQAKMILARSLPRDPQQSMSRILDECRSKDLAEKAIYEFPRGDSVVRGASIRLVECVARHWGNVAYGIKELASDSKKATVKVYCWDLETNVSDEKIFDVEYIRTTKKGSYTLTDERDKYEMLANKAARRKRACMQSIIPQYVIDEAMAECQRTLEANTAKDGDIDTVKAKMLHSFQQLPGADWVTEDDVAQAVGKPYDNITARDIAKLRNLYNAIKDGYVKPAAAFKKEDKLDAAVEQDIDTLNAANKLFGGSQ